MAPELVNGRFRARRLALKYNNYFPEDATPESLGADREVMLRDVFGKVGADCYIDPPFHIDYGCNILLGERFYANFKCVLPTTFL